MRRQSAPCCSAISAPTRSKIALDSAVPGLTVSTRNYQKIGAFLTDVKLARIYGGMHYRNSVNDGATLGTRVGNYIGRNYFKRMHD